MKNILTKLAIGLAIITTFFGINSHVNNYQSTAALGAAPQFTAAKPTALYGGGIGSSDTNIKIISLVTPANAPITTSQLVGGIGSLYYATIEPSTSKKETVGCTAVTQNADGTAIMTGCSRGLSFTFPYTASSSLALSHSGGSTVVLSNSPQLYQDIIAYINGAVASSSGVNDASLIAKGIVQVASGQQAASGTPIGGGSTSAPLALTSTISTSTCPSSGNYVVVTSFTTGKIPNTCIGTLSNTTLNGTTTLATSTIIGSTPAFNIGKSSFIVSTSSIGAFIVPSGVTKIFVRLIGGGGGGGASNSGCSPACSGGGGGGGAYVEGFIDTSSTTSISYLIGAGGLGGTGSSGSGNNGATSTFSTLIAGGGRPGTGNGSNSGVGASGAGGTGSGGYLNINGGDGISLSNSILSLGGGTVLAPMANSSIGIGAGGRGTVGSTGAAGVDGALIISW